jgi:fructose-1,6-bisphosphatase
MERAKPQARSLQNLTCSADVQVHQRVPLFIGSKKEVEYLESFTKKK